MAYQNAKSQGERILGFSENCVTGHDDGQDFLTQISACSSRACHNVFIDVVAAAGWPSWTCLHRMADRLLLWKEGER